MSTEGAAVISDALRAPRARIDEALRAFLDEERSRVQGIEPRAIAVLDEGVEMKRRIIEELRPTLLDNLGISSALDWQVRQVCERAGLQCELNLAELELPSDASIAIYRIVQEAMTNIAKYASARNVDVELLGDAEGVSLIVHDDGAGLPAGVESNRLSHGIIGMRQRVRALNGTFKISSRPGTGTTIEVFIPLPTPGLTKSAYSEDLDEHPAPLAPPAAAAARTEPIANPTR